MTCDQDEHPRAVCILITRSVPGGIEVLGVSRRDDETAFGLPGGKVEPGEDDVMAAKRELRKETGLDAMIFEPIMSRPSEGPQTFITTTFRVKHFYGVVGRRKGEGLVKWMTPDVLISGPFGRYNDTLFKKMGIPLTQSCAYDVTLPLDAQKP